MKLSDGRIPGQHELPRDLGHEEASVGTPFLRLVRLAKRDDRERVADVVVVLAELVEDGPPRRPCVVGVQDDVALPKELGRHLPVGIRDDDAVAAQERGEDHLAEEDGLAGAGGAGDGEVEGLGGGWEWNAGDGDLRDTFLARAAGELSGRCDRRAPPHPAKRRPLDVALGEAVGEDEPGDRQDEAEKRHDEEKRLLAVDGRAREVKELRPLTRRVIADPGRGEDPADERDAGEDAGEDLGPVVRVHVDHERSPGALEWRLRQARRPAGSAPRAR